MSVKRPLQRLYPLEVKAVWPDDSKNEVDDVSEVPSEKQTVSRPRRVAAIKARERCQAISVYEQEDESMDSH